MTTPDDHLDLDDVAALDEGLDDDADRRAHLESCDLCAQRLAQVRTTRALLSALPDEPIPAEVANRVHAALPGEPLLHTIVPVGGRRRWTRSPALAGIAAAAAAIALVAAISVGSLRSSGHDATTGADSGGAALRQLTPSTNFPVLSSGARYDDANAQQLVADLDGLVRTPATLPASPTPSGAFAGSAQKDALSLSAHAAVPPALQRLFGDKQAILTCARLLAEGPVTPLAVDFARFTGGQRHLHNAPAMIVLLRAAGDLRDSAFIVGPKCTTDPSQDFYFFVQVPSR